MAIELLHYLLCKLCIAQQQLPCRVNETERQMLPDGIAGWHGTTRPEGAVLVLSLLL